MEQRVCLICGSHDISAIYRYICRNMKCRLQYQGNDDVSYMSTMYAAYMAANPNCIPSDAFIEIMEELLRAYYRRQNAIDNQPPVKRDE